MVVKEGGYSNHFFAIEEGTAKVERDGEHLADLGPGRRLRRAGPAGEAGALRHRHRHLALRVIKIEHWELSRMRKAMPEVVEELQRKVEERKG